ITPPDKPPRTVPLSTPHRPFPPEDSMPHAPSPFTRRAFLSAGAAATGAIALGCSDYHRLVAPMLEASHLAASPDTSGIEHIVLVMMENRSFDHMLGWLPRADGRQGGLFYQDAAGVFHPTHPLAPDFQGCGRQDPDHSYDGARTEF